MYFLSFLGAYNYFCLKMIWKCLGWCYIDCGTKDDYGDSDGNEMIILHASLWGSMLSVH